MMKQQQTLTAPAAPPAAKAPDKQETVIQIEGLKLSFGPNKVVLKGVDMQLFKGENVVVLGKSGTGKSVLIKCIVGLICPDAGKILVLGRDVPSLKGRDLDKLRVHIGFLFQSAALYDSMSVAENLLFPLRRHRRDMSEEEMDEAVDEALASVGLKEARNKMPAELSGGMRKRVGLARTIILKPDIILYDEPTTGLDPVTSREISELILKMQKTYGISSLIITHDLACARITSNRVLMLQDGHFVAEGTLEELEKSEDPNIKSFFL